MEFTRLVKELPARRCRSAPSRWRGSPRASARRLSGPRARGRAARRRLGGRRARRRARASTALGLFHPDAGAACVAPDALAAGLGEPPADRPRRQAAARGVAGRRARPAARRGHRGRRVSAQPGARDLPARRGLHGVVRGVPAVAARARRRGRPRRGARRSGALARALLEARARASSTARELRGSTTTSSGRWCRCSP